MMKWISVHEFDDDDMPEINEVVLAYDEFVDQFSLAKMIELNGEEVMIMMALDEMQQDSEITHYMRISKPKNRFKNET